MVKRIELTSADFEVQTFRAGGKGGQHQNTRETAVRVIHKETGLRAESREHRSQRQNKKAAYRKVLEKLADHYTTDGPGRYAAGHERVRTYHKPDDRVVDHDTGEKYSYRQTVEEGEIGEMIEDRLLILNLEEEDADE